ncbi:hypothetical protein HY251_13785, partial [bacterium]|nr:hypothetical protein [bacterium]
RPGRGQQRPGNGGGKRGDRQGGRRDAPRRPSRWDVPTPVLNDDEVDEERILRARGDAEGRPYYDS